MAHLRFRGTSYPLGDLRLHIDPTPGGSWWLIDADRTPELLFGEEHDLSSLPTTLAVDNRSLDEMLERLTGAMMMYWPPGTTAETTFGEIQPTRIEVLPGSTPDQVRIELDAALIPELDQPSDGDEGPHRLELSGVATLIRQPPPM